MKRKPNPILSDRRKAERKLRSLLWKANELALELHKTIILLEGACVFRPVELGRQADSRRKS